MHKNLCHRIKTKGVLLEVHQMLSESPYLLLQRLKNGKKLILLPLCVGPNDYPMTIQLLSNDYSMTIQWLKRTFDLFFLMIIDLKRSKDWRWLFKSGATFILIDDLGTDPPSATMSPFSSSFMSQSMTVIFGQSILNENPIISKSSHTNLLHDGGDHLWITVSWM